MTLLRDLIEIPERVHRGDFVLKLTEGVLDPAATLRDYVVTEQLVEAFDKALSLVESAVRARASKATYLHGSFGSGKSHFMAVLYLLLRQEPAARALPELAEIVARHDAWLAGKRFLLVPFHLIGARNLESAILGGYAEHLRKLHPDAPQPGVYVADAILHNADQLRGQFGDEQFFAKLGAGAGAGAASGWGDLDTGWDAASYERARRATPASDDRRALVSDLLRTFFSAYETQAAASGEGFVPMDQGLSEIAHHAAKLGYHGLVLFLDELILWLASRAGHPTFVEQQIEALVKLVEAERADRPIPIVSFVARQRDLRKLIGDHMPGADRLRYVDKLDHYEGRFGQIRLESRNLARIVEKRLLQPKSDAARLELDTAFQTSLRAHRTVVDTLLGEHSQTTFRAVYPFSPALVDALIAVSSVLQRERTALKLLSELLVAQRDTLEVGDLVPVGDLWAVLAAGDEPFSEEMRTVFEQAKKLWRTKLRPLLENQHKLAAGEEPPRGHAFHGDARLLCTILLAALAPEAPELRNLTVSRLVALNHGSIRAPIAGQETQLAATKLREWVAGGAGEIHLGEGTNPTIGLELTGVDVEGILERVRSEDNDGNRARKIRELLFRAMEIDDDDKLFCTRKVLFKGTWRVIDVVFGNVRELPDDTFTAAGERWKLVIDFPFDKEGFTPSDDLARLEDLRHGGRPGTTNTTRTICWLPSFFSRKGQAELGRLVLIDHLLTGERFEQNAGHLPPTDRQSARALLANSQNMLRARLAQALEVACGLRDGADPLIDRGLGLEQHLQSLDPTFTPRPPVAASFKEALEALATQALTHQFPAHPGLGPEEVRGADLEKVFKVVIETIEHPEHRLRLDDKTLRELMRRTAVPLRLGEMHEAHFVLGNHWVQHFEREAGRDAVEMTVARLRGWCDRPLPMGLTAPVQDLVIRLFAAQTHRTFTLHGVPVPNGPKLTDELGLAPQEMPSPEQWQAALERAATLFGLTPLSSQLTATNLGDLARKLGERAGELRGESEPLRAALQRRTAALGVEAGARAAAAESAGRLLTALERAGSEVERLRRLGAAELRPSAAAVARTLAHAGEVRRLLDDDELWRLLEAAWRRFPAETLREEAAAVLRHDELAQPAAPKLRELRQRAVELLAKVPAAPAPTPSRESAAPTPSQAPGWRERAADSGSFAGASEIEQAMTRLRRALEEPGASEQRLELRWTLFTRGEREGG